MRDVTAICEALAGWAKRWELSAPRLSAGWIDMPDAYKPLIRDGRVERPILEPPANAADEAAVVAATGGALPDDLRALHAVHDGTFAPRLPSGMSMAPYATTPTRWRSFPDLGDDDGAEPGIGIAIVQIPPRPFLAPVLEKYGQRADVERWFLERVAKLLNRDFGGP